MNRKKYPIILLFYFILPLLISIGCANQQPPGGGEIDKTPPEVYMTFPVNKSVNVNYNKIVFEFSEYVDKRSFQEAIRIYPALSTKMEFSWSKKEVEIIFGNIVDFKKQPRTYVVIINTNLVDLYGNKLSSPVTFAFSTGSYLDTASVSGRVLNNDSVNLVIAAYQINDLNSFDPLNIYPDYLTETSVDGRYKFKNISKGTYRIFAFEDEDKNSFYTSGRESYGVSQRDILVSDTSGIVNFNIYLKKLHEKTDKEKDADYTSYFKDSLNIIFSSVKNNSLEILPEQTFFFFFNKHKPNRSEILKILTCENENKSPVKFVINWLHDSLFELIPSAPLLLQTSYRIGIKLKISIDSSYHYNLNFRTVSKNSFGSLQCAFNKLDFQEQYPGFGAVVKLTSIKSNPEIRYYLNSADSLVQISNIYENEYKLFSFLDYDGDMSYNYGSISPYVFSEPFFVYQFPVKIKAGWTVENLRIMFH